MFSSLASRLLQLLPVHRGGRMAVLLAAVAMTAFLLVAKKYDSGKSAQRLNAAHERGETAHWTHYVNVWTPRAAAANAILCGLLILGGRWFFRHRDQSEAIPAAEPGPGTGRITGAALIVVTAGSMLWSGIANAPRLEFGLWADEESTMRKSTVGEYERAADGSMKFQEVTWGDTLFRYRDPNNHLFHSVLARAAHRGFARSDTNPGGWYFDGRALRLPVFLCGIAMLAAVAWLAHLVRMPLAGCAAVILLACHPWWIQLATEARGYGIELLLVPLSIAFGIKALMRGTWGWWIAFGLAQFLILWTWPAAVHLLLVLSGAVFVCILFKGKAGRRLHLPRFSAAGIIAVMPALHLLLPVAQPLVNYLKIERMQGDLTWQWYADAACLMLTGQPWQHWSHSSLVRSWEQAFAASALPAAAALTAAGVLLLTGVWACWRRGGGARIILAVALLHVPLVVLHAVLKGNYLYYVYVALSMPLLVFTAAAGAGYLAERRGAGKVAGPAAALLCLAAVIAGTFEWRKIVRENATEPYAAAAAATRTVRHPAAPDYDKDVVIFAPVMATRGYDPGAVEFNLTDRAFAEHLAGWKKAGLCPEDLQPVSDSDAAAFVKTARHAHESGRRFLVHVGVPDFTAQTRAQIWALLQDPRCFVREGVWHGLDVYPISRTREVYRYTGDAVALDQLLQATAGRAP